MNDKSINLFHISHPILLPKISSLSLLSFPSHNNTSETERKKKRKLYCLISRCAVFSIVYASITLKHKINAYIKHDHEYNFLALMSSIYGIFFVPVDTSIAHTQRVCMNFFCILQYQVIHVVGELCIFPLCVSLFYTLNSALFMRFTSFLF